ncbi:MAG: SurA N-terminal domain-containing protein [Desulfobulbaceae bacterium]|nr:SurA N-terminal domain-containing protein [Desulfobulbaceae bacterium]
MLNILRKNAQSIIIQVIVVVIAVVFVFWGVGSNLNNNPNALAVVNGKEISYRDFQKNYEQAVETYKQQLGGQMPQGFLESIGLKEQVLNQLIQSELLRQGAEKIGVVISNEATQRKIQEMEVFKTGGRFDLAQYKAILERNRLSPTAFETGIKNDLLVNRVINLLGSFAKISEKEVRDWVDYIDLEIKLAWAVFKSADYLPQVKVDEEGLQAWYATRNQNYKFPPQSKLQYLFFNYDDDLKQVAIGDEAIQQYYQENASRYNTPEQRRARHILIKAATEEGPELRAAKKSEAENVLNQIRKGGDFAQLARQFSEDSTKNNGGDLGFFSRGKMVQAFEETVFNLKKGEVSGLVETSFGYHIIKLEDVIPEKMQSFGEVRASIRKELEQQAVKAITFKKVSTAYEDIIKAGSLAKYSEKSGSIVKRTDFFAQINPPQDSVVRNDAFLQAAFGLRKGELSSIVETENGYAIIFVDDIKVAVVPELSAVREQVVTDFKKEKSVELARLAAEDLLKKVKEQQSWPAGQEKKETAYIKRQGPSGALPDQIRQNAYSQVGKEAYPEKAFAMDNEFYIYQIVDSRPAQEGMDEIKRRNLEQQLLAAHKNKLMADWLDQLRKQAKIWTNVKMLQ